MLRDASDFKSRAWGAYLQDLVQVAPAWKLLGGLRYDSIDGTFNQHAIPNNAAGPVTTTTYQQSISEWSRRVGVLYRPNALQSFHFSYGTSLTSPRPHGKRPASPPWT